MTSQLKKDCTYEESRDATLKVVCSVTDFEDHRDTFERAQAFKKSLRDYLSQNPLGKGEKLAIVSHGMFLSALTGSYVKIDSDGDL